MMDQYWLTAENIFCFEVASWKKGRLSTWAGLMRFGYGWPAGFAPCAPSAALMVSSWDAEVKLISDGRAMTLKEVANRR